MNIRDATLEDLATIVAIYNSAIPGRLATADLEPAASIRGAHGLPSMHRIRVRCGSSKKLA
jgi:hypothetical protein